MGTCYTLWIHNEHNHDFGQIKDALKERHPHCCFMAEFSGWLIVDIDKTFPFDGRFDFIKCDHILISDDNGRTVPTKL